jgi:hypothetical protein
VEADALAFGRARQETKPGGQGMRERLAAIKAPKKKAGAGPNRRQFSDRVAQVMLRLQTERNAI